MQLVSRSLLAIPGMYTQNVQRCLVQLVSRSLLTIPGIYTQNVQGYLVRKCGLLLGGNLSLHPIRNCLWGIPNLWPIELYAGPLGTIGPMRGDPFWQKMLGSVVVIVWPRELVRLIDYCLKHISIFYFIAIRRPENVHWVLEVQCLHENAVNAVESSLWRKRIISTVR